MLDRFILNPLVQRVLEHPMEDRYDARGFADALVARGFDPTSTPELGGIFAWIVATKPASPSTRRL